MPRQHFIIDRLVIDYHGPDIPTLQNDIGIAGIRRVDIFGAFLSTMFAQQFDDFGVAFLLGIRQRRPTVPVSRIDISSFGNQQFDDFSACVLYSVRQGILTIIIFCIDIRSVRNK
ncbi:hypothetical protein ES707_16901 [subsurface metagenome]